MEMIGLLAGGAALFGFLHYMPQKTLVVVKLILGFLLCIICIGQLRRFVIRQRRVSSSSSGSSHLDTMASQPEALKPIELKLSIDKTRNQVLFAESNKAFVDVLLSFLTLPMGTIVRLADKKSGIGSMDKLYKSAEGFDEEYFWTKAGKSMLLDPRSAYGIHYNNLIVKVDETDYTKLYTCRRTPCFNTYLGLTSLVKNSICACGQSMDKEIILQNADEHIGKTFVNGTDRYIIRDDLKVEPASTCDTLSWIRRRGIRNSTAIKEEIVNVGLEEVLHLLHRSMISKTPLTDVFVVKDRINIQGSLSVPYQYQREKSPSSRKMKVQLWYRKSTNEVIFVQADEEFVDLLLSFLTLPSGAIIKLLKGHSSMGSMDKLYESVKKLMGLQLISTEWSEMLLNPKLERMFGCSNQLLQIEEKTIPTDIKYNINCFCSWRNNACGHAQPILKVMNPKRPAGNATSGGGFIKGRLLLVTDNLEIKPLSPASDICKLKDIPFDDLECKHVTVAEEEALNLLQASIISKNVLNHAFRLQRLALNLLQASLASKNVLSHFQRQGDQQKVNAFHLKKGNFANNPS
ncbi:hypothetical protein FNV43_RR07108 [Rhamnella rubrinervis]|uniref:DUF674 family protein n=1 Tax=Rhamnella rubrinervis TaxID=2594499 RepID=A0A8K0HFV8_9ROSA|nr:hypothetical protein FNV43_RR07108 [Rhamnella rubrinervis]